MPQTDYENPSTSQWTSTDQSAANTALTVTAAAGGVGSRIRLHRVTVSSDIANTTGTLTIEPDGSTASWKIDLDQKIGIVGDFAFDPPILGKDNTKIDVVAGAMGGAGNAAKGRVSIVYDYQR